MTLKKCQLCSRISLKLNAFISLFIGPGIICRCINRRTFDANKKRVAEINAAAPDCACEKSRMSHHSPGVVQDSELLARFVFSPIQIDKKGRVKPNSFSHVHSQGCSIQRDAVAKSAEALALVKKVLIEKDDRAWKGVVLGRCSDMRSIIVDKTNQRAVCAYDTADSENPAHAELCQTQYVIDEADQAELRHNLFVAFGNGAITVPPQYRNGDVWNSLDQHLRDRQ